MSDLRVSDFDTDDGLNIAVHELGPQTHDTRPVILIHGYFSDAYTNWIKYGHAAVLADAGYRVIMPDLRAHGMSDKPHAPSFYPRDILADDQLSLIDHLGLTDYDVVGYSLGGRTVARMLARGAKPRKAVISGMGFEGLTNTENRADHFRHILTNIGQHERGSPAWMAEAFLKTSGGDPAALIRILDTFVNTPEEALQALETPIGVVCGGDDFDNGSAAKLAKVLRNAHLITVPGNHMSAVAKPDLGIAIRDFLLT
jgi:pimeloyl-ACP methyl ester carboxylesterase